MFFLDPGALPIGFFYGVAMGIGMAAWVRKPWAAIIVLITTMYAWSAAIHTADPAAAQHRTTIAYLVAASLCAGAVGAGLTHLGCALFAADLRRPPWRIALTCVVGAVAGMLFYLGERKYVDERLLYFVWQPAVAFCIGLGAAAPKPERLISLFPLDIDGDGAARARRAPRSCRRCAGRVGCAAAPAFSNVSLLGVAARVRGDCPRAGSVCASSPSL